MAKANIRSPYHVYITAAGMTRAVMELYIYTGEKTALMPSITYTIDSTTSNTKVTFEIAELIKDYLDVTFSGAFTSQVIFCNYRVTRYVGATATVLAVVQLECLDGYGYFSDGVNPLNNSDALQTNKILYILKGAPVRIPIFANVAKTVDFLNAAGALLSTTIVDASTHTSTQIVYAIDEGAVAKINVKVGAATTVYLVESTSDCKYPPWKIVFINKFGALQELWFFTRSYLTLTTTVEKYNANILVDGSYSISAHQNRILKKQGSEKLTLNSGFYPEEYNEVFQQMLLSEKIWVQYGNSTSPGNITSSSFAFKTQLNDKLINYTIEIDFAFDKINSVR